MFSILHEVIARQQDDKAVTVCSYFHLDSSIAARKLLKYIVVQYKYVLKVVRPLDIKGYYDQFLVRMQNYENTNKGVQLRLSKSSLKPVDLNSTSFASFSDHENTITDVINACVPAIAAVDLQFCTAVLISNFTENTNSAVVVVDNIVLEPQEYVFQVVRGGEMKVRVCLHTLRRKLTHTNAGVSRLQAFTHVGDGVLVNVILTILTFATRL